MPTMDVNYFRKLLDVANSFHNCSVRVDGENVEVVGHEDGKESVYRACGDIELNELIDKIKDTGP